MKVYSRVIIHVSNSLKYLSFDSVDDLDLLFLGQDVYEYGGHAKCVWPSGQGQA